MILVGREYACIVRMTFRRETTNRIRPIFLSVTIGGNNGRN